MKKYQIVFEKSFLSEPIKGRIIDLGDKKDNADPDIPVCAFAYKIFYSNKPIEELQRPFELPEYVHEKTIYFGQTFTVEDYIKRFPDNKLDENIIMNPDTFVIIQASPVGVPFAFPIPVYKNSKYEVIDYKLARKFLVSTNSEIAENHKTLYAF